MTPFIELIRIYTSQGSRRASCYYSVVMSVSSHIVWLLTVALLLGPGTLSTNLRPNFPQYQLPAVGDGLLVRANATLGNKYDHKVVRIEVIYRVGNETSEVYDPNCPTSDHTAWVYLRPYGSTSPDPPELQKRLGRMIDEKRSRTDCRSRSVRWAETGRYSAGHITKACGLDALCKLTLWTPESLEIPIYLLEDRKGRSRPFN